MKVAINCANARDGGAIQVAVALLHVVLRSDRYAQRYRWASRVVYIVSPEVFSSLTPEDQLSGSLVVPDGTTRRSRNRQVRAATRGCDVVYTVFAPWYGRKLARFTASGFADGQWVRPESVRGLARLKYLIRKPIAGYFYRREDALVHQTTESLDALRRYPGFGRQRMAVAPNCLNPLFVRAAEALEPRDRGPRAPLVLVYVARYYLYKNHAGLAAAQRILAARGLESICLVTMSGAEWDTVPAAVKERFENVGIVPIGNLAQVYARADIAVFPSLNESFSASPVEALLANGLLVASDRPYVREVCGDAALYVEPDPEGIAEGITELLADAPRWPERRESAKEFVATLPTAQDMADIIMGVIDEFDDPGRVS